MVIDLKQFREISSAELPYAIYSAAHDETSNQMPFRPDRMVEQRELLKLKQEELAEILKIPQQQVSSYEKGIHKPNMATLVKLSRALQCSTDYLLGLIDTPDNLRGLTPDEQAVLTKYRERRAVIEKDVINEGISELANPLRDEIKRIIARVLREQRKFDTRRNKP